MSSTSQQKQKTQALNPGQLIEKIRQLDSIKFEEFTITLFTEMGYKVQATSKSSDEGVSLALRNKNKRLIIAECRRDKTHIDQTFVKNLYQKMVRSKADEVYLVTTGTIDISAQHWAVNKPVNLIDGNRLVQLIESIKTRKKKKATPTTRKNRSGLSNFFKKPISRLIASFVLTFSAGCCLFCACIIFFSMASELLPTPTVTPTFTPTLTPTFTPTLTPTETWTPTETLTPTVTLAPSLTFTRTSTSTPRSTFTSTSSPTFTPAPTKVPSGFTILKLTSPVRPGSNATVQIKTAAGTSCSIGYVTPSGTVSNAAGLGSQTANKDGICSWTWKISGNTRGGTGKVIITANGVTKSFGIQIR